MSLTKVSYSMIQGATINALDYGATGNGTTNDTVAIQAAIDAAVSSGNGTVYFPAGTYKVSTLNVYPSGTSTVIIEGDGPLNTIFSKFGTSTDPVFNLSGIQVGAGAGVVSFCQFKNFGVSGISTCNGIVADTLYGCVFESLQITGCNVAFKSNGSLGYSIKSCAFVGNNYGLEANNSAGAGGFSNLISVDDTRFQSNSQNAINLVRGQQIVFNACDLEGNGASSSKVVYIASTFEDETLESSVSFNNCWWEGNTGSPLYSDSVGTWINMEGCNFYASGASLTFNNVNQITLNECYGTADLTISGASFVTLNNCLFNAVTNSATRYSITNLQTSTGSTSTSVDKANTVEGSVNTSTGVAATMFTGAANTTYVVTAYITGGATDDMVACFVVEKNVINSNTAARMTISVDASYNVQVTQTTGTSYPVKFAALRLH